MFKKLLILSTLVVLNACTGSSGGSNNGTPIVNTTTGIIIDPMTSVPVINGSSTQGTLYIHNYSDQAISGLNYSLNNSTIKSQVKSLLSRAGFNISGGIEDSNGFVLLNPERCQSIASNSSCAINFTTPSLSLGNQGSSLVTIDYTNQSGKATSTSQVVNYNYVNGNSSSGVNFSGSLEVNGTAGSTKYVVGYIYAGGASGSLYTGVNLVPSNSSARINGGFINNQEVATNQVIAVEFAVAVQNTTNSYVNITPTWSNSANISATAVANGVPLSLSIVPAQNAVNYIFGNIPILEATPSTAGSISVVNNGNANGIAITVENSGGTPDGITVDASDCTNNVPQADGVGSCSIAYTVTTYTPGSTTLIYKSNSLEVGRQIVYWTNNEPFPLVQIVPSTGDVPIVQGESSGLISFSVTNIGNTPLESMVLTAFINGSASWIESSASDCGSSLAIDGTCTMEGIISAPTHGMGTLYYRVQGEYAGNAYTFSSLPVRYIAPAAPQLNITPVSVVSVRVLANNESSVTNTYWVENSGNARAFFDVVSLSAMTNLNKPVISGSSTCSSTTELSPTESCSVIVTYGPESSDISINESGSTHVVVDYSGGTPDIARQVVSESYNYSLVGNDTYVIESITVVGLTGTNPYSGNALTDPMYINIVYTNPSVNYPLTNFNLNTNNLPYGMLVDDANTSCPIGSSMSNIAKDNGSCTLRIKLDRELLSQDAQGGSVVLDFTTPRATWTTPLGFYSQAGTSLTVNYLQPTVSFSLSNNNGGFESTTLTMTLSNESAGLSPFVVEVSKVNAWLEGSPLALSTNCTITPTLYSASCSLESGAESGQIAYFMPEYIQQNESTMIPLFYTSSNLGHLSPAYNVINYTSVYSWQDVGNAGFSAGSIDSNNLALDVLGTPYVAYQDGANSDKATVMRFNGTNWINVGSPGFSQGVADSVGLAINPINNRPYVAYQDGANSNKATVMRFDGTTWVYVGESGFSGAGVSYTRLAFDESATPYIAYQDGANSNKATVMKFDGANWVYVGESGFSAEGVYNLSLAIDSSGIPYVAYQDFDKNGLVTVMKFDGTSSWVAVGTPGFSQGGNPQYISLAFNPITNEPYVAYSPIDSPAVTVANSNGATVMKFDGTSSSWDLVGSVGFSGGYAEYISLAFSLSGIPYVAYQDATNSGKATVMKFDGASWVAVGISGFSTARVYDICLAIDPLGIPYVAYEDSNNKETVMKYIR